MPGLKLLIETNGSCDEKERLIGGETAEYSKSCRRQLLAAFLASLMALSSGTVVAGWTPTAGRKDDSSCQVKWTAEEESWIIAIYVVGALIGALPSGRLSMWFGRKNYLLWLAVPMVVGWTMCFLWLNSLTLVCLGRFLCGLSVGATTVAVPLYASDVSSDVLRGRSGLFLDFMLCAGIQYAYVARSLLPGLRHFIAACAVVPLTFVALFSYMPESPNHLFNQGRYDRAASALRWLRGKRIDVKREFERFEKSRSDYNETFVYRSHMISAQNRKVLIKVMIITFGLNLFQRLSGAGGIIQYINTLFSMSGIEFSSNVASIIFGTFQLIGSFLSFLFIDKAGRRTLLLISSGVVTTCLFFLIVYYISLDKGMLENSSWKISILFILCVFITAFRLGLSSIPWFISTELMPTEYGGLQSISSTFSWSLSFLIMKTFKEFIDRCPIFLWCTFTVISALGFVFILFYVLETNNKSREQIRAELIG